MIDFSDFLGMGNGALGIGHWALVLSVRVASRREVVGVASRREVVGVASRREVVGVASRREVLGIGKILPCLLTPHSPLLKYYGRSRSKSSSTLSQYQFSGIPG